MIRRKPSRRRRLRNGGVMVLAVGTVVAVNGPVVGDPCVPTLRAKLRAPSTWRAELPMMRAIVTSLVVRVPSPKFVVESWKVSRIG